jgi:8-oxo-dGTP diphosphatase
MSRLRHTAVSTPGSPGPPPYTIGMEFDTRVAAYGVIVADGSVLLARWTGAGWPRWTLPGGGLEYGEDAATGAVREIREETGYSAKLQGLLGVDSKHIPAAKRLHGNRPLHAFRVIYAASIIDGELKDEADGSTDLARWIPLHQVRSLDRVDLVDLGLRLLFPDGVPAGHSATDR